jgi:hypothetical protein
MFKHTDISGDFGYTVCHGCGGWWEGPEDPSNSPCEREAQSIRSVRGHYEYLVDSDQAEKAVEYLEICKRDSPLAFDEAGNLKEVYWNDTGSTL